MPIKRKPTTYNKVLYDSMLEARWAVFLDNHPLVNEYAPQPQTFSDTGTGWTYTPDFIFSSSMGGALSHAYIEVKPVTPTSHYLHELCIFAGIMRQPLILAMGSFYKGRPKLLIVTEELQTATTEQAASLSIDIKEIFFAPDNAAKTASEYRFDLPDESKPNSKKSERGGPGRYMADWASRQRKKTVANRKPKKRRRKK